MQQCELALSLDHVRVVRNDLSDCDVEIVPSRQSKEKDTTELQDYRTTGLEGSRTTERQDNRTTGQQDNRGEVDDAPVGRIDRMTAWGRATRLFSSSFMRSGTEETVVES
jgi:hypothetical protein